MNQELEKREPKTVRIELAHAIAILITLVFLAFIFGALFGATREVQNKPTVPKYTVTIKCNKEIRRE